MIPIVIRTGGQTGVDQATLDFALRHGLSYGGWCPRGGWAADSPTPPGVLARYPKLCETPSEVPAQRTAWNVRDSHATLILVRGQELSQSPGTLLTRQCAELFFLRPWLVVDLALPDAVAMAKEWLARTVSGLGLSELWLNVAGPREEEAQGIYGETGRFLAAMFLPLPHGTTFP